MILCTWINDPGARKAVLRDIHCMDVTWLIHREKTWSWCRNWNMIFKLIQQWRLSTLDFQADRFKSDENGTDIRFIDIKLGNEG